MAIEGYVYDFTSYIPHHPTPAAILTPWCGREATEGMRTKGYGRDHTPAAWSMMSEYLVGVLAAEEQADADRKRDPLWPALHGARSTMCALK